MNPGRDQKKKAKVIKSIPKNGRNRREKTKRKLEYYFFCFYLYYFLCFCSNLQYVKLQT